MALSVNPFVVKQTNLSATDPYPVRHLRGPLLSLFMATKEYYGCPVMFCFSCVVGLIFWPYFDHFIVQKLAPLIC